MLRVIVELVPGGFEPLCRRIASMTIANVSDLADRSDYMIQAVEGANPVAGLPPRDVSVTVEGHDRRQSVWSLVERAAAAVARAESDPV